MLFGLIFAVMVNSLKRSQLFFRTCFYLPVITSWVIVGNVFAYMFNAGGAGLVNYLLKDVLGLLPAYVPWLNRTWTANLVIWLLGIWKNIGWAMVIYLAGLQGISNDLYEASMLDGASRVQQFWRITVPLLKSTTFYVLVNMVIGSFGVFIQVMMLTSGNPRGTTSVLQYLLYDKSFNLFQFGQGAAIGMITALLVLLTTVVLWFMLCNSFEEFSYVLPIPPHLVPSRISFAAYEHVLSQSDLPRAAYNSVIITLLTACFTVLIASLSAYGFARIDFLGREVLFRIYLFTLMLPGFLGIIPQFLVLQGIGTAKNGLIGTKAGLILLYVGAGICGNTFFLRGHMAALPKELEEAVKIDGGGHMTTFFRVMLPLALPSIGTLAIFCLQGTWEEFFSAKVILGAVANQITLPVMIQSLKGAHATRWEWIFSASILAQIPMILLFAVFQKRFVVSGLSDGSVKA